MQKRAAKHYTARASELIYEGRSLFEGALNRDCDAPGNHAIKMHQEDEGAGGGAYSQQPEIVWLEQADNPWQVPVLDVRPVTLHLLSASRDEQCAANAISFLQDDGLGFIGQDPPISRSIEARLRYRLAGPLADGALFIPEEMEHKWAIYLHQGRIICIRSWLRQVRAVAEVKTATDGAEMRLEVRRISGAFVAEDEEPDFTIRVLDYLLRSHAMGIEHPAPLPAGLEQEPLKAALWCMSSFGNRAPFATPFTIPFEPPERPLRTDSLLHLAVARGDLDRAGALIDAGAPIELLARNGQPPLHWAIGRNDRAMVELLLARGASIESRSDEGATPLMMAVETRSLAKTALLLDRGADPNATDLLGLSALDRATETGQDEIARLLIERGAKKKQ